MSYSQIFKSQVPISVFINFLEINGEKKDNKIIFSKATFKKSQLTNTLSTFLDKIKHCYYPSKQMYVERAMSYKNLVTIIRQICKNHHISFNNEIKYSKSKYEIIYTIFLPTQ